MPSTKPNLPADVFNGGYDEHETIEESLFAQLRRHVDWYEDGVRARLDQKHGMKLANAHYHWIRLESMRRVAKMAKALVARIEKTAAEDKTEF